MKSGTYRISFDVVIKDCENEDEAHAAIMEMVEEAISEDSFPEVNFELLEEIDLEYTIEEEIPELDFEETA